VKRIDRRYLAAAILVALVGGGISWATSSTNVSNSSILPDKAGTIVICDVDLVQDKDLDFPTAGTFHTSGLPDSPEFVAETGTAFIAKDGRKTVPLIIHSNGGHASGEGIGETRFWYDPNRPAPSAIAENTPGTEFPATQTMRFNFFFTAEAFPGKVFRSVGPATMRSTEVRAFPPPPGTVYTLVSPVDLEDVAKPGVVVGQVVANRAVVS
jgi:hypothetical protein